MEDGENEPEEELDDVDVDSRIEEEAEAPNFIRASKELAAASVGEAVEEGEVESAEGDTVLRLIPGFWETNVFTPATRRCLPQSETSTSWKVCRRRKKGWVREKKGR